MRGESKCVPGCGKKTVLLYLPVLKAGLDQNPVGRGVGPLGGPHVLLGVDPVHLGRVLRLALSAGGHVLLHDRAARAAQHRAGHLHARQDLDGHDRAGGTPDPDAGGWFGSGRRRRTRGRIRPGVEGIADPRDHAQDVERPAAGRRRQPRAPVPLHVLVQRQRFRRVDDHIVTTVVTHGIVSRHCTRHRGRIMPGARGPAAAPSTGPSGLPLQFRGSRHSAGAARAAAPCAPRPGLDRRSTRASCRKLYPSSVRPTISRLSRARSRSRPSR